MKISRLLRSIGIYCLLYIAFFTVFFIRWFNRNFHNASFEQLMFFINVPVEGAESEFTRTFYLKVLLLSAVFTLLFVAIKFIGKRLAKGSGKVGTTVAKGMPFYNKAIFLISIAVIAVSAFRINKMFRVGEQFRRQYNQEITRFYEDHYVDPRKAEIVLPAHAKKQNLIVVYIESMEKTFSDEKLVGKNLIPHLSSLTQGNQSFANFKQGYAQYPTQAALVSSMISVPITYLVQMGRPITVGGSLSSFAPHAFSIGQVLKQNGYQNVYVQGTLTRFSGTDVFLKSHGFDAVYDINAMTDRYEKDQPTEAISAKVRGRFYDEFTYNFFKEKLSQLPKDKPFYAVMATMDTHFGNYTPSSQKLFATDGENTIHHASFLAGQFMDWVKKQPFAKNTTVVFVGDHLMMRGNASDHRTRFLKKIPENARSIFNVFVNARRKAPDLNRHFAQIDMFPTFMEALGYEIKGGRLGLGTSLFSKRKTLTEELGESELNNVLSKKNRLYDSLWETSGNP